MTRNFVLEVFAISSTRLQKRSTFVSSSGASTSSRTQIGAGFDKKTANKSEKAVKACSHPESNVRFCSFFPGGLA